MTVFPEMGGMRDWGYCREQQPAISDRQLAELRQACLGGNRGVLRTNTLGLYRTEEDDCCEFFRDRDW